MLDGKENLAPRTCQDAAYGACRGNIGLEPHRVFPEEVVPEDLLQGGVHLGDVDYNTCRQELHEATMNNRIQNQRLPREVLFDSVQRQGLV